MNLQSEIIRAAEHTGIVTVDDNDVTSLFTSRVLARQAPCFYLFAKGCSEAANGVLSGKTTRHSIAQSNECFLSRRLRRERVTGVLGEIISLTTRAVMADRYGECVVGEARDLDEPEWCRRTGLSTESHTS